MCESGETLHPDLDFLVLGRARLRKRPGKIRIQFQQDGVQFCHAGFESGLLSRAGEGDEKRDHKKTPTVHAGAASGIMPDAGLNFAGMRA
jgi:hypothetical protein